MSEPRVARINTEVTMVVNLGNYESVRITKGISIDVSFGGPAELRQKSANLDAEMTCLLNAAIVTLKREAENATKKAHDKALAAPGPAGCQGTQPVQAGH